jgi:16S rRNA (uracil1498-N3)-methyltransferase
MDRFFLPSASWDDSLSLTRDEAHHCRRVMRKKVGDQIEVFDGEGRFAVASISSMTSNEVTLDRLTEGRSARFLPTIEIAVGIPKGKTFDLILQKAVELGVNRIQPLVTDQGNVRITDKDHASTREKWQRAALEACKQCGQNYLPEVFPPRELSPWLGEKREGSQFVGALQPGARPFRELLEGLGAPESVTLLIGPEGDFTGGEYQEIAGAGFAPVDLGELVLRTETAVFAMVAAVRYQFQNSTQ